MFIDRLIAGAAAATLLAGAASAQTSGSTSPTGGGAMQAGGASQPYAAPPVTGGAAQPSASASEANGTGQTGASANTSSAMGQGTMGQGGMANPGAMSATGAAGFRPIQAIPGANIVATLKASGEFTKLVAALDATNLTALISTHPNLTLFAPTDAAFAALPPGQLDTLMKSPAQLQAILSYHFVATAIKEADIKGHSAGKVPAADNKQLNIDGSGPTIKVNDANVLQSPVMASNGYIYPIDKVLVPPAA